MFKAVKAYATLKIGKAVEANEIAKEVRLARPQDVETCIYLSKIYTD